MIPVGDLFNHHNPPAIEWAWGSYHTGQSGVFYTAIEDIEKGKQATYSYGTKSNYHLLAQYGFIDLHNPIKHPVFLKHVNVLENDPLRDAKLDFFGDNKDFQIQIKAEYANMYTQDSLSILRVIFFDEVENVDKLMSFKDAEKKHVPPLSNRSEMRVLHHLIGFCHEKLSGYTRTFQGDLDLFNRNDQTTNHRNALHITLAEKVELLGLIEHIKKIMDLLQGSK